MTLRKQNKSFYFSVEGQTEEWYLEWLQKELNNVESNSYKISIVHKVFDPVSFVKWLPIITNQKIYHLSDYESKDKEHKDNFLRTIDKMDEAQKIKSIKYYFGYSNFSFDLWMILHKKDCFGSLTHRKDYLKKINEAYDTDFESMREYKQEDNFKSLLKKCSLSDVVIAIERSKKIQKNNMANGYKLNRYKKFEYYDENPSLMVWKAIEVILQESGFLN